MGNHDRERERIVTYRHDDSSRMVWIVLIVSAVAAIAAAGAIMLLVAPPA